MKSDVRTLLRELLLIDLNYRQQRGLSDTLEPNSYFVRFPGCRDLIAGAFRMAGLDVSDDVIAPQSGKETWHVPVETSSGFKLVSAPPGGLDLSHHLKSTINEIPQQLGGYVIQAELGRGGMGVVYRAFDTEMKRTVAIKVMNEDRIDSKEAVLRFRREIRLLGNLNHDNVVRAFHTHVDEATHTRYLVMEYVEGEKLETLVRRLGPLPVADACELIRRAAMGLEHAHKNGLVHRDLKPDNIMLSSLGEVKVLDLGLARPQIQGEADTGISLTKEGQLLGTPHYMSPEQIAAKRELDHRSDIYSLGCTLYKLLTGQTPFGHEIGTTLPAILIQHANDPFPPASELRPEVPAGLVRIIHQMTEKTPEKRQDSAAKVEAQLKPYCKGSDLSRLYRACLAGGFDSPPTPPPRRGWKRVAVFSMPLLALLVVLMMFFLSPPEPSAVAVDVLAAIEPDRDAVRGKWERTNAVLKSPKRVPLACLRLPQAMPREFQLEITAQRKDGVDLTFVNRHPDTAFAVAFSVNVAAAGGEAKAAPDKSSILRKGWAIQNPHSQTIVFRVRKNKLLVERDGQILVERSEYPELPPDLPGLPPNKQGFFIVADDSQYEFSRIEFSPLESEN